MSLHTSLSCLSLTRSPFLKKNLVSILALYATPVSYTHLDVYKRQILTRMNYSEVKANHTSTTATLEAKGKTFITQKHI